MKNRLLIAFFVLGTIMLTAMRSRPVYESPKDKSSIELSVKNAEFYSGEIVLEKRTAVYLPIESRGGYIVVDVQNKEHKQEILTEFFKQYSSKYINATNIDKELLLSQFKESLLNRSCTEWRTIAGPEGGETVVRTCCSLVFCDPGCCWTETCECGYCCD